MNYHLHSVEETLKEVNSTETGLTSTEANQRLLTHGKNKLAEPPKRTFIQKFLDSIKDPMIIMLLAAAALSTFTTVYQNVVNHADESYADLLIILFVLVVNTILGIIQEDKAEEAIEALKEMTATTANVYRDGELTSIKAEDLVVGDVISFADGDAISADCRIISCHSLKVEEAALTGESVPVDKIMDILMLKENSLNITLGDRTNMLYSGSTVVYGRGKAVVVATGMDTEMGKIASALSEQEDEQTPLQKKMAELSTILTKLVVGICVVIFAIGIIRELITPSSADLFDITLDTFILAVAVAVAAIPEGLPAVVTVILSIGVTEMSKHNALIRKLTAVETLGCTQIICSDKTGTLTENKMTVVDEYTTDSTLLMTAMALCCDAYINEGDDEAEGEPTEAALINYAYKNGYPKYELTAKQPRIGEAPFDSSRMMMTTVHQCDDKYIQYTKGATEAILAHCTHYLNENHEVVEITDQHKQEILANVKTFAARALRVLSCSYKPLASEPVDYSPAALENNLIYIGFTGMIDPCRKEVYQAIEHCKLANIRPIMITGDHIDTAIAIGKDLGIISDASQARIGSDINNMTDEQLQQAVQTVSIWARVQPEHKTKIVKTFKSLGYVVAMTGDGVNDAPSIKAADIGVGMGITGTDVTKGVADMVLADDNFATIVNAVEEGRKVYDNVRKVLQFQLSTNMSEVIVIFISSLLGINFLSASHLLWINMVTDSAPGLALGMEKAEPGIMNRKPRSSDESIFAGGAGVDMIVQGVFMAALIIVSFFIGDYIENGAVSFAEIQSLGSADGMTMAFLTCNFVEIFHAISMRTPRGNLFKLEQKNWWLLYAFILTTFLTLVVIYVPFLKNLMGFTAVSFTELLISIGLAFLVIPVLELFKAFFRAIDSNK